uniref:Uncharacterized protein n=1 Tax=Anopheles stephensi TaxID=30069 RepID=A0A182YF22_ANOST
MPNGGSVNKSDPLLARGTIVSGAVSVSLDDSWTGRSLLEALGRIPLRTFDDELVLQTSLICQYLRYEERVQVGSNAQSCHVKERQSEQHYIRQMDLDFNLSLWPS